MPYYFSAVTISRVSMSSFAFLYASERTLVFQSYAIIVTITATSPANGSAFKRTSLCKHIYIFFFRKRELLFYKYNFTWVFMFIYYFILFSFSFICYSIFYVLDFLFLTLYLRYGLDYSENTTFYSLNPVKMESLEYITFVCRISRPAFLTRR